MGLEGQLAVAIDGAVTFSFAVSNTGTSPVEMRFANGLLADVVAYDDGEEVWRWSDGRAFTQAIATESLMPGESFTHEATWATPDPGEYTAVATLAATNVTVEARAAFQV